MSKKNTITNHVERDWFVVDAEDVVLGRLSTRIATILRGKHKPQYEPHHDHGDFVVVINADKVRLTGDKEVKKIYHRHTGWVGGLVSLTAEKLRERHPTDLVKKAVWGMIPKGPLGRQMYSKLKVYAGSEHPHEAQQPQTLAV